MKTSPHKPALLGLLLAMAAAWVPWLLWQRYELPAGARTLYRQAREARLDYEHGIERIIDGEPGLGHALMSAAAERLAILARSCAETEGCDEGPFLHALGDVFHEREFRYARGLSAGATRAAEPPGLPLFRSASPDRAHRDEASLRGHDLRELIPLNRPVLAALADWLTWNRPQLLDAYENYGFLREKIAPIYEQAGLPEALLFAIMATESGGKAHAYSPAGAVGPLQFMRSTGRRYGLHHVDGFDMRLDPVASTAASAAYLNDRLDDLGDDLAKTLAAYNVGETRLRQLARRLDGAEFWDGAMQQELPKETREYVPRVLAAAWIFLHPDDYGVRFPAVDGGTTRLLLDQQVSLAELSVCLGQQDNPGGFFRALRNLNPRLDPAERLVPGDAVELPSELVPDYVERCREGARLREWARALHDARYEGQPPPER